MEPAPEEFEKLRKLLALKRHETPPPGYFDGFSAKVVGRIRAGENAQPPGIWQRLIAVVSGSPALASVFVLAMVAFILTGANLARRSGSTAPSAVPAPAIAKQPLPEPSNAMGAQLVNAVADPGASNSTPPKFLVHPGSVLVNPGSMENAETQQVKFPK